MNVRVITYQEIALASLQEMPLYGIHYYNY